MIRSLIVAMTPERVIGRAGGLPWRLSADLRRFKRLTIGHPIVMGRKTFESLPQTLPGRTSIVVTRDPLSLKSKLPPDVLCFGSVEAALDAVDTEETFVIGGGEIFRLALPFIDRMYVTWVDAAVPGDTFFPEFDLSQWREIESESIAADEKNEYPTRFRVYEAIRPTMIGNEAT